MLLEELATTTTTNAVHAQHATQIIHADHREKVLERIEQANRVPIVVYDTEWNDEKTKPISTEYRSNIQNAQQKHPVNIEYEQAKINSPKSVLSRERYEHIENNNQETTEQIQTKPIERDRSIERIESNSNLISNYAKLNKTSLDNQQILCHPIDNHLQINDEQTSSFADDSLLIRHQEKPNINVNETTDLENPLRSTAFVTLNYPHHNQEQNPSWQRAVDQHFYNKLDLQQQQHTHIQSDEITPRYLPSISSAANEQSLKESDNFVSEFHQLPLLHENVRIQNSERISLVPSTQINQSRPIYRVRQQQIPSNDEYNYSPISSIHPDHIDRINTAQTDAQLISTVHVEPQPVTFDIQFRVRPTPSETSSLVDMESFLNRFEDSLEPEQHLPLVDQISLSYTTTIRSNQDGTERAIERYEQEHPFFSRSLPSEWLKPAVLPHEEQLVEQWIVEKNLETIQQQVESSTNIECESAIVAAAAIATDAYCVGERFEDDDDEEEEESNSLNTKNTDNEQSNNQLASAILVSHCSPTSDYETDSLDKDNDTASTTTSIDAGLIVTTTPILTTLPLQSPDTIPVDYLLETLTNEEKEKNELTKDFLLTIGYNQNEFKPKQDIHCAKENELEQDENLLLYNFDENQQELLNIFFEPAHFHLPLINEISIYQISFHHEYPIFSPSNLSLPIIHNDDQISSNQCQTNQQQIFSIAQINHQSDHEDDLENLSQKFEQTSYIEQFHIQSLYPFSETLYVHIDEPPTIIENDDEQSIASVLPDVIPSTTTAAIENEVMHGNTE